MKKANQIAWLVCLIVLASHSIAQAQNTEQRCKKYAATGVSQNQTNKQAMCNYTGLRWNDDAAGQARWCMSVPTHISDSETKLRQQLLKSCLARRADALNKNSSPQMPGACRYNTEGYKFVHYIFAQNNDNSGPEAIALLPNGLIKYDFNRDGRKDYIFLERNHQHKFRSIFCTSERSNRQGWKREVLTKFREDAGTSIAKNNDNIVFHQGKLNIGNTYTQHNWGTTSTYSEYSYSMNHKSFLLDKKTQEFTSAALGVSSTKLVWDYEKGELRKTTDCGYNYQALELPCDKTKNNQVIKMEPPEYTLAVRKQLKF